MKKVKILFVAFFLILVSVSSSFALGGFRLGVEFGDPTAVLILRTHPYEFKLGYNFAEGEEFLFLSADYRIVRVPLIDFLGLYISAGVFGEVSSDSMNAGVRIPLGINAYLANQTIEIFGEVVPNILFVPSIDFAFVGQGYFGFTVRIPNF